MVIHLTINFSDGPRTLARSGLGWGPPDVAIAWVMHPLDAIAPVWRRVPTSFYAQVRHVTKTLHPPNC